MARGFPVRAAAIDIGSNALRFLAVEALGPARWVTLRNDRAPLRLGHDAFGSGRLSSRTIEEALRILARFAADAKAVQAVHLRAVATSALRESDNASDLISRTRADLGLRIDVITGSEEARLVHRAVRDRIPLDPGPWLLVDLGGGSVEVSLADGSGIHHSESHSMGSVRLLEVLGGSAGDGAGDAARFLRLLTEYVSTLRIGSPRTRVAGMIATGGNSEALARLSGSEKDAAGVSVLQMAALQRIITTLAGLSVVERQKSLGLREDRADVILPAAVVYAHIARQARVRRILVPSVGLREGVIADLLGRLAGGAHARTEESRQALDACVHLGERYGFEKAHALQVTRLALALFDGLEGLHGMGEAERRMLTAAAVLHDVGTHVSYAQHHKHSFYLISNSELPGFTAEEMRLAAHVARYHRKSEPSPRHDEFAALASDQQHTVSALAALLRMADALDREHLQSISSVEARVLDGALRLRVRGRGDFLLAGWALEKKAGLFRRLFGLEVAVDFIQEDA